MATADLSVTRARDIFSYDPSTGELRWRTAHGRFGRIPSGGIAGTLTRFGYLVVRVDGRIYFVHRVGWTCMAGAPPSGDIDHINGVKTDNRALNLREASRSENMQNRLRPQRNSKTGITGVFWDQARRKYVVAVKLDRKHAFRKRFDTLHEAIAANDAARAALHPFAPLVRIKDIELK